MKGKTVVIGDIHGRSHWKDILDKEKPNRVIFVGDYFDSFTVSAEDQIVNFRNIFKWKEQHPQVEVVTLIGNHDIHYFPYISETSTSGYQPNLKFVIGHLLSQWEDDLKIAYQSGEWLFTHAGVSEEFLQIFLCERTPIGWEIETIADSLNELFKTKPNSFLFNAAEKPVCDPYGGDSFQSPIWIRPNTLMKANKKSKIKRELIQVVGHTDQNTIDMGKSTGGRYFFIDAMRVGEYLIIENGTPLKGKIEV
jgi:hypothetical protein